MSAKGLTGMIRNPCACSTAGTAPASFSGSREAPTTAIVTACVRISWGLRLMPRAYPHSHPASLGVPPPLPGVPSLTAPPVSTALYDVPVNSLEGEPVDLADYRDRTLLVVNVASKCGLTPQYEGLERLQRRYGSRGVSVLGFPSHQF